VDKLLEGLPIKLENLFTAMLERIDLCHVEEASLYFAILNAALRPLKFEAFILATISPREAVNLEIRKCWWQRWITTSKHVPRLLEYWERRLVSRCHGLVEVQGYRPNQESSAVQYIHQSVKDFMKKKRAKALFLQRTTAIYFNANTQLLGSCLQLLKCRGPGIDNVSWEHIRDAMIYAHRAESETGFA
jgi:hypothetical protein